MPETTARAEAIARSILARTDGDIRLALPLGLGKPVTLVNALTKLVAQTPSARLSILTALTLERPSMPAGLARRFMEPAADRLFGAYPQIAYAGMMRDGTLPPNIEVSEFFMMAGRWLGVGEAQRNYIAANYTHAYDRLREWNPNVVMQLLAEAEDGTLSLSCNTDITADLLRDREAGRLSFLLAGEVNRQLPAMGGDAATLPGQAVDLLMRDGTEFELFSAVKRPVGVTEHAIGLHVARLIRDGGTLQIGIGAIGDAVAHALLLRHAGQSAPVHRACPLPPDGIDDAGAFDEGLYCVTEMLVDGLLQLFEAGIIRREVDGAAIHAGFFVDCRDFYARLRDMPEARRDRIRMVPVSYTNQLYGDEAAKRAARRDARFVNAAMKATLLGGIVSDATAQGREVSGIGGQFNFIEQAFALEDGRAIITLPATRTRKGRTESNIVWDHPHESVPRAYRDIVVTEYGIADLRGQRDAEVVKRMLRITDARFQDALLDKARAAGKIGRDFSIPDAWRVNTPGTVAGWLAPFDLPQFPFGSDFDETERRLLPALDLLSETRGSRRGLARLVVAGLRSSAADEERACMARMGLDHPRGMERLEALALKGALAETRREAQVIRK
ncbi:acetyl-CoA hydrolase/transferase C-terminal domain-containing protein [Pseudooceanicola sp.]|uniref:acetyl-CoA hydrolase/transferase C-terminal domain-containing protein n=1 Tax=Pseudooceanicola sp. TaxID=1914328 RepID=UPI003515C0D8